MNPEALNIFAYILRTVHKDVAGIIVYQEDYFDIIFKSGEIMSPSEFRQGSRTREIMNMIQYLIDFHFPVQEKTVCLFKDHQTSQERR